MRQILKYFGKYRKYAIVGAITKFIEATIELAFPFIMALIIDNGIRKSDQQYTIQLSILLIILAFIGVGVTIFGHSLACKASYGLGSSLRNKVFRHLQILSSKDKASLGNNSIINRLNNDIALVEKGVVMMIRLMLRAPIICIGGIILALVLDVPLSLVIISFVPILLLFIFIILRFTVAYYKVTQQKLDIIALDAKENIAGLRIIKAFDKIGDEKKQFNELNESWRISGVKTTILANSITPFTSLIMNIGITLIILFGAYRINDNAISHGTLIAFITYVNIIVGALVQVTNLTTNISKAFASSNRVMEVLNIEPSMKYGEVAVINSNNKNQYLEFKNVDLMFGKRKVLSNINFKLEPNMTLGILGGTGSGKSTIANLLSRTLDPSNGEIILNGYNIKDYEKVSLKNNIAIVYQNDTLIRGTILDNIVMGRLIEEDSINKAIRVSQFTDFLSRTKEGLNYFIEEAGKNLSGGQKQRLTIARALAGNPHLLILDDSFSALDYLTDYHVRRDLKEYKCTKVFISQRISAIKDADLILVLQKGEIINSGNHEYLMKNCQLYQQIDASQKKVKK